MRGAADGGARHLPHNESNNELSATHTSGGHVGVGEAYAHGDTTPALPADNGQTTTASLSAQPVNPRAVARPAIEAGTEDQRASQIRQVQLRFRGKEASGEDGASLLQFDMQPSDPDFPFEIKALNCVLNVPEDFPHASPSLRISNKEMERGYQLNVERGFDGIWSELRQKTLLNALKLLDRRLEPLLVAQKAETIKIISNAHKEPRRISSPEKEPIKTHSVPPARATSSVQRPINPVPTQARVAEAHSKRQVEIQQLKQRLGRDPTFKSEANDSIFTVPITVRKTSTLPASLQYIRSLRLIVPDNYNIDPPVIQLQDREGEECVRVEKAFAKRAKERHDLTLLAHVNYLAQNMHTMATQRGEENLPSQPLPQATSEDTNEDFSKQDVLPLTAGDPQKPDRSHVIFVPRPPEWDWVESENENEDGHDAELNSDESDFSHSGSVSEAVGHQQSSHDASAVSAGPPRESGVMLSFPSLELFNVELLELTSISVSVKCTRCKEIAEVQKLRPESSPESDTAASVTQAGRNVTCKKCSLALYVAFRPDLIHMSSQRAGYLDLEGCDPVDLLPSTFLPTCANCSTTHAAPGVVSVRGASDALAVCRGCHNKMLFKIPEVRFLRVGPSATNLPLRVNRPRQREKLGIVAGEELPARGACKHYSKSYRWFRFSCCQKVYACDKCHDEAVNAADGDGHMQEFANRMICGFCSREQVYKPKDCGYCGKGVTGRTGTGFWEGGKGTRDPKRMSKKDPRKFRMKKKMKQKALGGRAGGAKNA